MGLWNRRNNENPPRAKKTSRAKLAISAASLLSNLKNKTEEERALYASTTLPTAEEFFLLAHDPCVEVQRTVAENPCTPQNALAYLADCKDAKVTENVAKNVNVSPKTLKKLARHHTSRLGFTELSIFALTNPNCPQELIEEIVREGNGDAILASPHLTPAMIEKIFLEIQEDMLTLKKLTENVGEENPDGGVSADMFKYTGKTKLGEALLACEKAKKLHNIDYLSIAEHPNTPSEVLIDLLTVDSNGDERLPEDILGTVAFHRNTPSETLLTIMLNGDYPFSVFAAQNPNLTPAHIREYSEKENLIKPKRKETDPHPDAPETELSFDEEFANIVAQYTDKNNQASAPPHLPKTAPIDISHVGKTPHRPPRNPYRIIPEDHSAYSEESADERGDDSENATISIIIALAEHPNTPPDILLQMFQQAPLPLAEIIASNYFAPDYVLTAIYTHVEEQVGHVARILEALADSDTDDEDASETTHVTVDSEMFDDLETCHNILCALAQNPHLPHTIAADLSTHEDWSIRSCLASNAHISPILLTRLANSPVEDIQQSLADNPATPAPVLKTLSSSPHWKVRATLAQNPNVPATTLTALTHDKNPEVSHVALLCLNHLWYNKVATS